MPECALRPRPRELSSVGPSGVDQGKGGKYLLLPPGYKGAVQNGYFVAPIVYGRATWAFIYNSLDRVGRSSYDKPDIKVNADGSVDIFIGPKAPQGFESNWIPTQGRRPLPVMRSYDRDEAFWDKSFKMPDLAPA